MVFYPHQEKGGVGEGEEREKEIEEGFPFTIMRKRSKRRGGKGGVGGEGREGIRGVFPYHHHERGLREGEVREVRDLVGEKELKRFPITMTRKEE